MRSLSFALSLARREARGSARSLALPTLAVAAGVAALVALDSFTAGLQESVRRQAQALLGADVVLWSVGRLPEAAETLLADLAQDGARVARVTSFAAMARGPGGARLVQVAALETGYPFYGTPRTDPPGEWPRLGEGGGALADPSLLAALDAGPGDTVALGESRLALKGAVTDAPGEVGLRAALGPRVFIAARDAAGTRLLSFGARLREDAFVALRPGADVQGTARRLRAALAPHRVGVRTAAEGERRLNANLGRLGRYLGLASFAAVLLGGLGVAGAVRALVKKRTETIAVLRCLGATSAGVTLAYLVQALAVALAGGLAGAAAGSALQAGLPVLLADLLPVEVAPAVSWPAVASGVAVAVVVAAAFSLLPLLAVRRVSPLHVLRRVDALPGPRGDLARVSVLALVAAAVTALSILRTGSAAGGAAFALAVGATLGVLALAARGLVGALRSRRLYGLGYEWRQGLAGLHRPANQTIPVVVSLGFGLFLLATLLLVQAGLLAELDPDASPARPNLALFDVQPDQRPAVEAALRESGHPASAVVPVVPMRVLSVKGRAASALLAEAAPRGSAEGADRSWTLRREYRSTHRDAPASTETIVAGEWWAPGGGRGPGPVPVSVEVSLAREMGVGLGDEIVWDVQGLPIATRVTSLRDVEWARLAPNFFVVFPEGPLEEAPKTYVLLARVEDPAARGRLESLVAQRFGNVSSLDLARLQKALEDLARRIGMVLRLTALVTLAAGMAVMAGAVAASRGERLREAVLLRTLGATRAQVFRVVLAESVAVGLLASAVGTALAVAAAWALLARVLEASLVVPWVPLLALAAGTTTLAAVVGVVMSRGVLSRTPLEALRAES